MIIGIIENGMTTSKSGFKYFSIWLNVYFEMGSFTNSR